MSTLVHGIELDREMKPAWFRFGMLRLLHHLEDVKVDETTAPDWARQFRQLAFLHQVQHFQQIFGKFDRTAGHVARCNSAFNWWAESNQHKPLHISDPNIMAFHNAHADLPLYFDGMLFYLRIQADAYAKIVPYFYEPGINEQ
jgi:hypothetical protein